jgi:hypothetical protein
MGGHISWATASLGMALLSTAASAETFLDKVCKPGATWQMCYNKCVQQSGAGSKDVANYCGRRCTRLGCK